MCWYSLLLCLLLLVAHISCYNYCSITPSHTLCGYSGPKAACGATFARGLTQSEKRWVVDYHNRLRSKVAMGFTRQPSASNMMEMKWDAELAWVAQGLSDTCRWGHDCSDCRSVSRFRVGQNLYQSYKTKPGAVRDWKAAMDAWFHSEIGLFPISSVNRYASLKLYTTQFWVHKLYLEMICKFCIHILNFRIQAHVHKPKFLAEDLQWHDSHQFYCIRLLL